VKTLGLRDQAFVARATPLASGGLDADAAAYIAAMTTPPDSARQTLINNLITGLKSDGVWSVLDALYLHAAHDMQAGRLNARVPANAASAVNSPSFTTNRGFTGDGSTSYLSTGINPSTAGGNYSRDSASLFVWSLSNITNTGADIGGTISNSINSRSSTAGALRGGVNNAAATVATLGNSLGLSTLSRTSSTNVDGYRDSDFVGAQTVASVAIPNATIDILRAATLFSTRQIAVSGFGGSLTAANVAALHGRLSAYLTAIGAI